jgi:hypothetical protein
MFQHGLFGCMLVTECTQVLGLTVALGGVVQLYDLLGLEPVV